MSAALFSWAFSGGFRAPGVFVFAMNADEVVMFALDPEDLEDLEDLDTDLDVAPWDGGGGSFVGQLPRERGDVLSRALDELERTCDAFDSVDPSAAAAAIALRKLTGWLTVLVRAVRAARGCIVRNGPCEAYVSGVEMWALDVIASLEELARELNVLEPRWSAFRDRVAAIAWLFDRAAAEEARLVRVGDALPDDVREALDEVASALATFKRKLDEPMG